MTEPRSLVEVDGWLTDDPDELRSFTSGEANRWTFADQLKVDAHNWKPWAFWISGALAFAVGGAMQNLVTVALGVVVYVTYLRVLVPVVRARRRMRLIEAIVRFDARHPMTSELVVGSFVEKGGTTVGLAFLPAWAADATRHPDGEHHVLIAYDAASECCPVVGVRATGYRPAPSAV